MSEEGGRHDPVHYYGPWTWVVGFILARELIGLMFVMSDGFS